MFAKLKTKINPQVNVYFESRKVLLIAQYFPEIVGFLSNEIYNLEKETSLIDILRIKWELKLYS